MDCPYCGGSSRVVDSRPISDGVRRRRQCQKCERRFTTHERLAPVELKVVKAAGTTEQFQPEKLERSIRRVTRGNGIGEERVRRLVRRIEAQLSLLPGPTIRSRDLAEMVIVELESLHPLAHHRYRAHYTDPQGRPLPQAAPDEELLADDALQQPGLFEDG